MTISKISYTNRDKVQIMLDQLEGKYDAENNLVYDAPEVTASDHKLALCITNLLKIIDGMQVEIDQLKRDRKSLVERIK